MSLYNLKSDPSGQFRINKFNTDLDLESSYLVSDESCECPQFVNRDKRCRHQKMLKQFFKGQTIRLDTHWFYDYDKDIWVAPMFSNSDFAMAEESNEAHDGPPNIAEAELTPHPACPIPFVTGTIRRRI